MSLKGSPKASGLKILSNHPTSSPPSPKFFKAKAFVNPNFFKLKLSPDCASFKFASLFHQLFYIKNFPLNFPQIPPKNFHYKFAIQYFPSMHDPLGSGCREGFLLNFTAIGISIKLLYQTYSLH